MSNGEVCCLLGVCCPPASRRVRAVAVISADTGLSTAEAEKAFDWFDVRFDFAAKGTLQPLIDDIVKQAKHAENQQ